jgi:hypothetical protein
VCTKSCVRSHETSTAGCSSQPEERFACLRFRTSTCWVWRRERTHTATLSTGRGEWIRYAVAFEDGLTDLTIDNNTFASGGNWGMHFTTQGKTEC